MLAPLLQYETRSMIRTVKLFHLEYYGEGIVFVSLKTSPQKENQDLLLLLDPDQPSRTKHRERLEIDYESLLKAQ